MLSAEKLARAALQGFFGCPDGFTRMSEGARKKAIQEVQKILDSSPNPQQAPKEKV